MSLLNNILGRNNLTNIISQLVGNNPQLQKLYQEVSNVRDPKAQAIQMIKNKQISKEQFEQVKAMAKQLGLDESMFKELDLYL